MSTTKKCVSFLLILFIMGICTEDLQAQKKRRKSRKSRDTVEEIKEPVAWKENMVYEIGLGNPIFLGGNGSSQFSIGLKPSAGYKFHERISAGVFTKANFVWLSRVGVEYTLLDYGAGLYSRFKIMDVLYLKGEYSFSSYEFLVVDQFGVVRPIRDSYHSPLLGLGYINSGGVKWNYGIELLFITKEEARLATGQPFEFWLKFDYNF